MIIEIPVATATGKVQEDFRRYETQVQKVLREFTREGKLWYEVRFQDTHTEEITIERLFDLKDGRISLEAFQQRQRPNRNGKLTYSSFTSSDDESVTERSSSSEGSSSNDSETQFRRAKRPRRSIDKRRRSTRTSSSNRITRSSRAKMHQRLSYGFQNAESVTDSVSSGSDLDILNSDVFNYSKRKTRSTFGREARRSSRSTKQRASLREDDLGDLEDLEDRYRSEHEHAVRASRVTTKEEFINLAPDDEFRSRHCSACEACGKGTIVGRLVYCQGCCLAYHKDCLGSRNSREHLVTKVGEGNFVLQCRRCLGPTSKKNRTAPETGKCQVCRETGSGCNPFREMKSAVQEQKDRDKNNGQDSIGHVEEDLINNPGGVMFRCLNCWRAWHFQHLPPLSGAVLSTATDETILLDRRFREYCQYWQCRDCTEHTIRVAGLIAWKPMDEDSYLPGSTIDMVSEDDKAYLVRWENQSYFRATWMPGAWVWGVINPQMRKAFAKRDDALLPKMRTEDAIPEDFLRIDIVLDVKYSSIVDIRTEEVDKARIKEVSQALVKFKGLGYEDVVWESPPSVEETNRWKDFEAAYLDWVRGHYVRAPKGRPLRERLEKVRTLDFESKLEKTKQPDSLVGGELMDYQLSGLNWLYHRWYSQHNAILADEMGLGKTIQIIAFLTTLVSEHNCFPFLLVVPNSTCANWRREVKQWAPSLRVVAYYGSAQARSLSHKYELFPNGSKDLRCHVVVTSYDAAADDQSRRFLRNTPWQSLIVDEGQRLKNDKTNLYGVLDSFKIPFKILLTGTPLQNNPRELFNLLQFLDTSLDAAELERRFQDLDMQILSQLHELLRPFFLRRTKAQVLTFLPPMAQIILPVSMSIVQKKVYKSILAKSPELLKAVFSSDSLTQTARANLNNILMQLRKCLCHPFVYSTGIEERTQNTAVSHRNLVEASGKLQLLEVLLPKLRERGHRVLIFSQFLDMLTMVEDFLDGLELRYQRMDGNLSSLDRQKRIDEFNAPDSSLFAFLLSTRAGGVGINLASADTVIILDPDFNPHQDIQALSRAHRIGQKKKVLCFQLVTRASAEEKIVQIGRKKMALDHVLIERMDAEDGGGVDLESILRHGAAELFNDESMNQDIKYDSVSVDKLLDRSSIENTSTGEDNSAESQFSFARVWANDQEDFDNSLYGTDTEEGPNPGVWEKIMEERERVAIEEAKAKDQALGRGRRIRQTIDYKTGDKPEVDGDVEMEDHEPAKSPKLASGQTSDDTDFQAENDSDGSNARMEDNEYLSRGEPKEVREFHRVETPQVQPSGGVDLPAAASPVPIFQRLCCACGLAHRTGSCPLKVAGVELCPLCGIAHFGMARTCPHINSETQVRAMLAALKQSSEPRHLVLKAQKYLKGVKGHLVQKKKIDHDRARMREGPGGKLDREAGVEGFQYLSREIGGALR